jgi:transposase
MVDVTAIRHRFELLSPALDERSRRLLAAAESVAIGSSGPSVVARVTGVSRRAIRQGMRELQDPQSVSPKGIRRPGGGRRRTTATDTTLKSDLEQLVEPLSRGDPESPLRWTCKSVRKLAVELQQRGHQTSHRMVAELLHELGYSLQANRKTLAGRSPPDRNAQFEYINHKVNQYLSHHQPVISVDTKKRELGGEFKNSGREWHPCGHPEKVRVHDFVIPTLGRATPYGVYDLARNTGWVSVGVDHDTAAFAVESIRRWWHSRGREAYAKATQLLITADAGGSNGARVRLWKLELQKLADETGLQISVGHLPPQVWPEFKALVIDMRAAPSVAEAARRRQELVKCYQLDFPEACRCLLDEAKASLNHLTVPPRHQQYVRTSNLAERAFEEERRRTKVIPHLWDERSVVKLVFAVLIRVSDRWGKKAFSEVEQQQIRNLRAKLHLDEQEVTSLSPTTETQTRRSAASAA